MPNYFAYGSNMSVSRLVRRVGEVRVAGVATLGGFEHCFNKKGSDGTAKGNVETVAEGCVWGVTYDIDHEQLARLDVFESGYRRDTAVVRLSSGLELEVICYRAVLLSDELEPTHEYLGHYVAGAREHDIPDTYLRTILPRWFSL